jgi:hypothetical protein
VRKQVFHVRDNVKIKEAQTLSAQVALLEFRSFRRSGAAVPPTEFFLLVTQAGVASVVLQPPRWSSAYDFFSFISSHTLGAFSAQSSHERDRSPIYFIIFFPCVIPQHFPLKIRIEFQEKEKQKNLFPTEFNTFSVSPLGALLTRE